MPSRRFPLCLVLAISGFPLGAAVKNEAIAVSATAVKEYVRPVDEKGSPLPETYMFTEGKFFEGGTVDRGLAKTTFADITKLLATNLARQNYYPTTDMKAAKLLIMVHWGATIGYEDPARGLNIETAQSAAADYNAGFESETSNFSDPTEMNYQLGLQDNAREGVQQAINNNAVLLGFKGSLDKERRALMPTTAEITMSNELNEERYFIVLMAYDYQMLQQEKKSKLLWVTRLSVRSPGHNFVESLPLLGRAGSGVFGQHIDGLTKVKTPWPRGRVDLGDMKVVGPVETTEPAPQKQ